MDPIEEANVARDALNGLWGMCVVQTLKTDSPFFSKKSNDAAELPTPQKIMSMLPSDDSEEEEEQLSVGTSKPSSSTISQSSGASKHVAKVPQAAQKAVQCCGERDVHDSFVALGSKFGPANVIAIRERLEQSCANRQRDAAIRR